MYCILCLANRLNAEFASRIVTCVYFWWFFQISLLTSLQEERCDHLLLRTAITCKWEIAKMSLRDLFCNSFRFETPGATFKQRPPSLAWKSKAMLLRRKWTKEIPSGVSGGNFNSPRRGTTPDYWKVRTIRSQKKNNVCIAFSQFYPDCTINWMCMFANLETTLKYVM